MRKTKMENRHRISVKAQKGNRAVGRGGGSSSSDDALLSYGKRAAPRPKKKRGVSSNG